MLFIFLVFVTSLLLIINFLVPDSTDDSKFLLQIFTGALTIVVALSLIVTLSVFAHKRTVSIPKEYREVVKQLKSLDSEKSKELKEDFLERVHSHNDNASFWIAGFGKIDLNKYSFQE